MRTSLIILSLVLAACQGEPQKGVEPEPSELVKFMRGMEAQMQAMRAEAAEGNTHPEWETDHSPMFSLPVTDNVVRDSTFMASGSAFMATYEAMIKAPKDSVQYLWGETVEGCVECHESYCPGPVKRIRKLHLDAAEG